MVALSLGILQFRPRGVGLSLNIRGWLGVCLDSRGSLTTLDVCVPGIGLGLPMRIRAGQHLALHLVGLDLWKTDRKNALQPILLKWYHGFVKLAVFLWLHLKGVSCEASVLV